MSYFAAAGFMSRTNYRSNPSTFGMGYGWGMKPSWGMGGIGYQGSVFAGDNFIGATRIRLESTSIGNNPFASSGTFANVNGIGVGTTRNPFGSMTGIYNAQTGTRFGQLTTPGGVQTALSGNIYNYNQTVERNPFATRTTTQFEDDSYIYRVRNTRSNGWFA